MSAPTTRPGRPGRGPLIKAYAASLTGTALEYYDFAVYSAAAALVFPQLFFPGEDPLTGTLLSFSTYAVGFIARPVGGVVFGRLGDKIGRKNVLVWTLVLIGVATLLIGLLPGYAAIGVAAPIILVLLRFAQGVGVGGEWGGAVLLSSEYGDPNKRGFWASAAQIGPPAGNLMANGVLAVLAAALTEEAFLSWGWRVAFLISAVLVAFGLWIRLKLEDTPVFLAIKDSGEQPKAPIKDVFATQKRALTAAALARVGPDVLYALFTVFVATYATQVLGMSRSQVLTAVLIGSACQLFLIPLAGALSDRINRRLLYGIAAVGAAIWVPVFFLIMDTPSMPLLILGVAIGLAFHALMYGPQAAYIVEQFDIHLRYAGSSLAYTLAGVIGGAIAPLVFTALLGWSGSWVPIALYLAGCSVVTIIGLVLGRDPQPQEEEHLLTAAGRATTAS
ncbi:MAG TPA: MFS transporter [Nakamurella sp.]